MWDEVQLKELEVEKLWWQVEKDSDQETKDMGAAVEGGERSLQDCSTTWALTIITGSLFLLMFH